MSLLNPHVYLDTVVLLGAVGSSLAANHRVSFAAGAMTASLLWFSALGLGARRCAFVLARPAVWRAIEGLTGTTMLVLAALLLLER
jgi:L-lysine exporter family protein LysE/ArgO